MVPRSCSCGRRTAARDRTLRTGKPDTSRLRARIRSHPAMMITADNKMGSARSISQNYSGYLLRRRHSAWRVATGYSQILTRLASLSPKLENPITCRPRHHSRHGKEYRGRPSTHFCHDTGSIRVAPTRWVPYANTSRRRPDRTNWLSGMYQCVAYPIESSSLAVIQH